MVLGRKIGYGQQMIPIHSVVIRSFFKVTVAFYAITMSAHYLEKVSKWKSWYLVGRILGIRNLTLLEYQVGSSFVLVKDN